MVWIKKHLWAYALTANPSAALILTGLDLVCLVAGSSLTSNGAERALNDFGAATLIHGGHKLDRIHCWSVELPFASVQYAALKGDGENPTIYERAPSKRAIIK